MCTENKCVLKEAILVSQKYKIENTSSIKNRKTAKEERRGRLRADHLLSNTGSSPKPSLGLRDLYSWCKSTLTGKKKKTKQSSCNIKKQKSGINRKKTSTSLSPISKLELVPAQSLNGSQPLANWKLLSPSVPPFK